MPFSFNPGQTTSLAQGGQGISGSDLPTSRPVDTTSPFLFIQQRGGELTLGAYLQIILLLLSVLSIIGAGAIFAYSLYLSSSIEAKKTELAGKEVTFKDYPFTEMKKLSDRAIGIETLLKEYVSIRSPLKLLEDVVEKQVVFNDFTLTREKSGGYIATFSAITKDYQSLIQQLEALKLTQYSKVAPTSKLDKFSEEKNLALKVKIITPLFVQGVLPDDVVFIQPGVTTPVISPNGSSTPVVPVSSTTPQ